MDTERAELRERLQTTLGDAYTVERELEGGGMSRVFVAHDARLGRRVVVKVLHPDLATGLSAARFEREVALAARLQHPHVVPLLSAGEVGGLPYYTMPYVAGETLRARLAREGALPVLDAVRLARELADALAYAHEQGVVHRDLKPENVLLSRGHAVVADFGVAKALASATHGGADMGASAAGAAAGTGTALGIAVGTPAYMAPEQAAADPATDHRADLYALGLIAYEALAGAHPFAGRAPQAMLAAHLTETPAPLGARRADVPTALGALVGRLLAKRPDDRPPSAQEVVRALDTVGTPADGTGRPGVTGTASPGGTARPRHARIAAALVGGALVLAATGALVPRMRAGRSAPTPPADAAAAHLVERRVAVAPFENQTGDSALAPLGRLASDWITQGIAQAGFAEVVDPQTVQAAWRQSGASPAGLGAATRARLVVSGAYYHDGDSLRILARIIDAADGQLLRAITPVSAPVGAATTGPRHAVAALRERVLGALATLVDARAASWSVAASLPPSLAAYRHWAASMDHHGRYEYRKAIAEARTAARLDSTYVVPLLVAASAHMVLGENATADSLHRVMDRSRDRLAPADQHLLDAGRAENHGDWAGALQATRALARLTPGGFLGDGITAWIAIYANRPREAIAVLSRHDPASSAIRAHAPYWDVLTWAHHLLGDYPAELAAAARGRGLHPDFVVTRYDEARALAALGRVADAERRLDEMLDLPPDPLMPPDELMRMLGREFRAHGHEAAAQVAFSRALRWYDERPDEEQRTPAFRRRRAVVLYAAGRWDEAHRIFEALAAEHPRDVSDRGYLAALAARRGDRAAALAADSALAAMRGPFLLGEPAYWRARIAALLGERERAVTLLREALQQGRKFPWDVHAEADLASLQDVPAFRELVRVKG